MLKTLESSPQLQLNASAQLELTGLSNFMTPGTGCDMTASTPIGQVKFCSYHTYSDIDQGPTISVYIDLASSFARISKLYCTIIGESPNKATRYFEHQKLLTPISCISARASIRNICDVLIKVDHWDSYPTLQSDDTITFKITVTVHLGPDTLTCCVSDGRENIRKMELSVLMRHWSALKESDALLIILIHLPRIDVSIAHARARNVSTSLTLVGLGHWFSAVTLYVSRP